MLMPGIVYTQVNSELFSRCGKHPGGRPVRVNIIIAMAAATTLIAVAACGSAGNDEADDENAEAKEGVFDPMVETMDHAREVEDLVHCESISGLC